MTAPSLSDCKLMKNKVVLVTGAAGGIGAATARHFCAAGASVALLDIDETVLKAAAKDAGPEDRTLAIKCDVTNLEDMQSAVAAAVKHFGGLDTAILNAGIEGKVNSIEELSVEDFEHVMKVNVTGPFIGLKACLPAIKQRGGGSVLMTSSVAGRIGTADLSPYTASKHALIGLMRSAALEAASHNIRINTVNPCPVETRMMRSLEEGFSPNDSQAQYAAFKESIPLHRYARPEEVADLFLFLASDAAKFITGGVYMIDGGMTA